MSLSEIIAAAWANSKAARLLTIEEDPNPVYSRLDRMDGLR